MSDLRGPVYVFQVICRDGIHFYLAVYKGLAFSGRIKYSENKSLDLFAYPLPVKNNVAMTSFPGCSYFTYSEITHEL